MRVKLEDLSPEKRRAVQDFKNDITGVFDELYEDKWNQKRWDDAMSCATTVVSLFVCSTDNLYVTRRPNLSNIKKTTRPRTIPGS
jgi:hypothetical protein